MEELAEIMRMHAEKYPGMKPQDCIKLLYQNTWGDGHMIADPGKALAYLKQELQEVEPDPEAELYVPIGSGMCRLNLARAMTLYSAEEINGWFVRSAAVTTGSMTEFMRKLKFFRNHFESFGFSVSREEMEAYLAFYRGNAYPAVHHSEEYRNLYHPHYRVIRMGLWETVDIPAEK